ncbi:iron complex outermembrane receptor protein [Methylobacter tundripaludum]|uniref:Iron complex outermembrane receptor protein n=1 Tax=Methylobacter tundripaludum TaxID=173365 RepID=A0A2S6HE67_9GAMM|nr:TonB-dependent receptor [Methylobacter tundripaludum]PPK75730.1 iron complex outermembrane receptor protein [Methylobacter tundripaludum]
MIKYLYTLLVGALVLNSSAFAESSASNDDLEKELAYLAAERQVVVTASKMEEHVDKTIATTTVITQDDIQHIGARNLLDVLRLVPGIGITQTQIGIREIEVRGVKTLLSEKVQIMLNGHPLDHNLQNAGSAWVYDDLPVDTIKRVEVVRGPGSALYGANAFLAVINIITQNAKDLNGLHTSAGWGSFDTQQYRASWGKQFKNSAEAALHFNFTDTNGINSPIPADSLSVQGLNSAAPGKSQLTEGRYDLEWQLGYQDFKLDGRYINKKTGAFFGTATVLSDDRTQQEYSDYFLRLSRTWKIQDKFTVDTQLFHDFFSMDNIWQLAPTQFARFGLQDTRTGGEIQANYHLSDAQTLISGFSYAKEQQGNLIDEAGLDPAHLMPIPSTTEERIRRRWGVYFEDVWDPLKNLRITLGARYDRYSDFGGTFNPRMGFNWEFIKNYSLKFSYGTAYRAPAFGELGAVNNPVLLGNPTLKPEEVKTFEAGIIAHPVAGLTTQVTYYHSAINRIISLVPDQAAISRYDNKGSLVSEGVELETRYDFDGNLQGSYISANHVLQHSTQLNQQLADVPRHRTNLTANWAFDNTWSSFAHILIKGNTLRNPGDTRNNVPGYALFDVGLLGKNMFGQKVDISFNVYNLLDKRYYDPAPTSLNFIGDYQMAGRAFFGHISLKF